MAGPQQLKEWAVYAYMCADVPEAAMQEWAYKNLQQMASCGSSDEVWVAAQVFYPGPLTYRYVFPIWRAGSASTTLQPMEPVSNADSGQTGTISEFFQWAQGNCQAKNILLVLWGHGFGIDYYIPPNSLASSLEDLRLGNIVASGSEVWSGGFGPPFVAASSPRSSGGHDAGNTILDNAAIGDELRKCAQGLPASQKLAIVAFDACVMAMAEVWCELWNTAALGVATQTAMPYSSFPYDNFLQRLFAEPTAQPTEVVQMMADAFKAFYGNYRHDYVTISACDLARMGSFEQAVAPLSKALTKAVENANARAGIEQAWKYSPGYDEQGFIDFGCFCELLQIYLSGSQVSQACGPALQALQSLVVACEYSPPNPDTYLAQSHGVSVWMPPWLWNSDAYAIEKKLAQLYLTQGYPDTKFSQETGWGKFLAALWQYAKSGSPGSGSLVSNEDSLKEGVMKQEGEKGDTRWKGETRSLGGGVTAMLTGTAGIILRASVEAVGAAGDAELHFTVKWPASALSAGAEKIPEESASENRAGRDGQPGKDLGKIPVPHPQPQPAAGENKIADKPVERAPVVDEKPAS